MRSPVKWHGGKSYLAQRIIDLMPEHTRYCEPFFGGGSVLFRKDPNNCAEFVNDVDGELSNFWKVIKSPPMFHDLQRELALTPLSGIEFEQHKNKETVPSRGNIGVDFCRTREAVAFFVRYRQSRQGLGKDYCTPTKRLRRGMNENVSAWLSAVDGLPEAHERLRRVEIWNTDACEFIKKLDSPDTLFYCDPPYLHETRESKDAYEFEMSEEQHIDLLAVLAECSGKFILSGYRSELYDEFAENCDWNRVDIEIDNKASSKKAKDTKTECLWMNF